VNMLKVVLIATFVLLAFPVRAEDAAQCNIPGIGPKGPVRKLHTNFEFTEGPAWDGRGSLFFSDIPKSLVYKLDSEGKLSVYTDKFESSNGLMFNRAGELVACEMAGRVSALSADGGMKKVIASEFGGKRFNAPNDLVIDRQGGIYFTDPAYGAPKPLPQGVLGVYYIAPDGKVARLVEGLKNPNGVILSPDEKMLYVVPTGQSEVMAYPVLEPGKIGEGKVFCRLEQSFGKVDSGGDGLTIDTMGNLYITSDLGIQVISPVGKFIGAIRIPEEPANCAFGGADMKTLYITARKSLYAVDMEATGHRFATGE